MEAKRMTRQKAKEAKERAKIEAREAKKKAKVEAREAKEAKKKAKLDAKEAKEREKQEARQSKDTKKREKQEAKEAKKAKPAKPAKGKAKKAVELTEGAGLYRGVVTLAIVPPIDIVQLDSLKEGLFQVENLRVVTVGGAAGEGSQVIVSAEEPLPLLDILGKMPVVEGVVEKGDVIQVRLKV